jgi:hypothetical protein
MFSGATVFDQNLGSWDLSSSLSDARFNVFDLSAMPCDALSSQYPPLCTVESECPKDCTP